MLPNFDPHAPAGGPPPAGDPVPPALAGDAAGRGFDAAIFDMDGVITRTAEVHALAWKRMFDAFLRGRALRRGEPFVEFTRQDYLAYVDGRPRYRGVSSFLESRGIALPAGDPADGPGAETVCGLGNAKNAEFNQIIAEQGVEIFPSTLALLLELRRRGVRLGVATSSRNASLILRQSGTADFFGTVVDGVASEHRRLEGKPAPDIFLAACGDLHVPPSRAIVLEDAVSGVQAGARGGFALVIGIARENNHRELRANGADLVVRDLGEISADDIARHVQSKRMAAS